MTARSAAEPHRASTTLEQLFDLCFAVAVAQASVKLTDAVLAGHVAGAVVSFLSVFFAIWWAWVNFTWFASAYDTDDVAYRMTTFVQIAGALIMAAGVPRAFDHSDGVFTAGYVLMRVAMVIQWTRAARSDPAHRSAALRYAFGIAVLQAGWVGRLLLPAGLSALAPVLLMALELAVPAWAARANPPPWHPRHLADRYATFTLIVLAESVLAATLAIQHALDSGHAGARLFTLSGAGLVMVLSMWWIYFDRPAQASTTSSRAARLWGYGHFPVLVSAAAVGAGLAVAAGADAGQAQISATTAGFGMAIPIAVFLISVWLLQNGPGMRSPFALAIPVTAALVLTAPLTGAPVPVIAGLLAILIGVLITARGSRGRPDKQQRV